MSKDLPANYDPYSRLKLLHDVGFIAAQDKQAKQRQVTDAKRRKAALVSWRRRKK